MLTRIMRPREEREAGLTLVEFAVVVAILGILAGIAIPVFQNQPAVARDASVKSDLTGIAKVMESLYTRNGAYPTTSAALSTGNPVTAAGNLIVISNSGTTGYTITGCNAESTRVFTFDSLNGGLSPAEKDVAAGVCTTAGAVAGSPHAPTFGPVPAALS